MPEQAAAESLHDALRAAQRDGDASTLERVARKLIALSQSNGDTAHLALGHYYLGSAYFWRSDGRAATAAYQTALELFNSIADRPGIARVHIGLAAVAIDIDLDVAKARRLYDQALPLVREIPDPRFLAVTLGNLAEVCRLEGDYVPAMRYAHESALIFMEIERYAQAGAQYATIAHVHLLRREHAKAIVSMREAWEQLRKEPNARNRAWYFDVWFMLAAALDRWEIAARLYGFVDHYRDANSARRLQGILPWFSGPVERLSKRLGEQAAHDLIVEGEALSLEQAQALVETIAV